MKKLFLAGASLALMASSAFAADLAVKAPYTSAIPAYYNWSGLYLGLNAGVGGDKVDYPFNAFGGQVNGSLGMQSFGGFGGVQVGYNYQFAPNWVAGVEADIQYSRIRSNLNANVNFGGPAASLDAGTEIKWFGTARGRIGYSWDRVLLYATGGYAFGSETTSLNVNPGLLNFSRDASLSGYVVGAGLEYALGKNVSMKTEYLYYDFGKRNVFTAPRNGFTIDSDITMHTLRAGLNYRF